MICFGIPDPEGYGFESVGQMPEVGLAFLMTRGAVRLSHEQHDQVRTAPHLWTLQAGQLVPARVRPVPLENQRAVALARVEAMAAAQRAEWLTPGLEGTYATKRREADVWEADHQATTPMLAAEAAATGIPIDALVATVLQRAAECDSALATIEATRQAAKRQIAQATSAAEIKAVSPWTNGDTHG